MANLQLISKIKNVNPVKSLAVKKYFFGKPLAQYSVPQEKPGDAGMFSSPESMIVIPSTVPQSHAKSIGQSEKGQG